MNCGGGGRGGKVKVGQSAAEQSAQFEVECISGFGSGPLTFICPVWLSFLRSFRRSHQLCQPRLLRLLRLLPLLLHLLQLPRLHQRRCQKDQALSYKHKRTIISH
jgi:hypothetical protein